MKIDYDINKYYIEDALLNLVAGANNLVVTTKCNVGCIFCSRKFNPFHASVFEKSMEDIKTELKFFRKDRFIRINTSISRVTDGEPFVHPQIWEILSYIRKKFPYKNNMGPRIQITTNGTLLNDENLKKLNDIDGIVLLHSINNTSIDDWIKLHRGSRELGETSISIPGKIKKFKNIEYFPSIVAMPAVTGWNSIRNSIMNLKNAGCEYLKIFLPTYTKFANEDEQRQLYCDFKELEKFVNEIGKNIGMYIQIRPSVFSDLTPKLMFFEEMGLKPDDEIIEINGVVPFSRTHAQHIILCSRSLLIIEALEKTGKKKQLIYDPMSDRIRYKIIHELNNDFPCMPYEIADAIGKSKKVLVMTSSIAAELVKKAFIKAKGFDNRLSDIEFHFQPVYNDFFGGNVKAGGLLIYDDYEKYAKKFIEENFRPELIIVGDSSFDIFGRDLLRKSIYELEKATGVNIRMLGGTFDNRGPSILHERI